MIEAPRREVTNKLIINKVNQWNMDMFINHGVGRQMVLTWNATKKIAWNYFG